MSELVVEYIDKVGIGDKSKVLDYGTGTGFLAIQAAKRGAKVVATDINPFAIECAKYNARKNELRGSIDFRTGKSFETIKESEKFDVITAGIKASSFTFKGTGFRSISLLWSENYR